MDAALLSPHDARQLCRLRALRAQRAQDACRRAEAEVDAAVETVRARQRAIDGHRAQIEQLAQRMVGALAPHLPRWAPMAAAQRDKLADLLERAEYALIDDEHALEQARERQAQARTALTRAQAGEDAARDLARDAARGRERAREQRVDAEIEDAGARSAPARSSWS